MIWPRIQFHKANGLPLYFKNYLEQVTAAAGSNKLQPSTNFRLLSVAIGAVCHSHSTKSELHRQTKMKKLCCANRTLIMLVITLHDLQAYDRSKSVH